MRYNEPGPSEKEGPGVFASFCPCFTAWLILLPDGSIAWIARFWQMGYALHCLQNRKKERKSIQKELYIRTKNSAKTRALRPVTLQQISHKNGLIMKKILSIFLLIVLLFAAAPCAFAEETEEFTISERTVFRDMSRSRLRGYEPTISYDRLSLVVPIRSASAADNVKAELIMENEAISPLKPQTMTAAMTWGAAVSTERGVDVYVQQLADHCRLCYLRQIYLPPVIRSISCASEKCTLVVHNNYCSGIDRDFSSETICILSL